MFCMRGKGDSYYDEGAALVFYFIYAHVRIVLQVIDGLLSDRTLGFNCEDGYEI